jgi:predicted unusual protein kinase regulating ubiquinone biosynthesis (AarF/ABC1/UbiB family)
MYLHLFSIQDRCPPYPTEDAINLLEKELGRNFDDIFDLI